MVVSPRRPHSVSTPPESPNSSPARGSKKKSQKKSPTIGPTPSGSSDGQRLLVDNLIRHPELAHLNSGRRGLTNTLTSDHPSPTELNHNEEEDNNFNLVNNLMNVNDMIHNLNDIEPEDEEEEEEAETLDEEEEDDFGADPDSTGESTGGGSNPKFYALKAEAMARAEIEREERRRERISRIKQEEREAGRMSMSNSMTSSSNCITGTTLNNEDEDSLSGEENDDGGGSGNRVRRGRLLDNLSRLSGQVGNLNYINSSLSRTALNFTSSNRAAQQGHDQVTPAPEPGADRIRGRRNNRGREGLGQNGNEIGGYIEELIRAQMTQAARPNAGPPPNPDEIRRHVERNLANLYMNNGFNEENLDDDRDRPGRRRREHYGDETEDRHEQTNENLNQNHNNLNGNANSLNLTRSASNQTTNSRQSTQGSSRHGTSQGGRANNRGERRGDRVARMADRNKTLVNAAAGSSGSNVTSNTNTSNLGPGPGVNPAQFTTQNNNLKISAQVRDTIQQTGELTRDFQQLQNSMLDLRKAQELITRRTMGQQRRGRELDDLMEVQSEGGTGEEEEDSHSESLVDAAPGTVEALQNELRNLQQRLASVQHQQGQTHSELSSSIIDGASNTNLNSTKSTTKSSRCLSVSSQGSKESSQFNLATELRSTSKKSSLGEEDYGESQIHDENMAVALGPSSESDGPAVTNSDNVSTNNHSPPVPSKPVRPDVLIAALEILKRKKERAVANDDYHLAAKVHCKMQGLEEQLGCSFTNLEENPVLKKRLLDSSDNMDLYPRGGKGGGNNSNLMALGSPLDANSEEGRQENMQLSALQKVLGIGNPPAAPGGNTTKNGSMSTSDNQNISSSKTALKEFNNRILSQLADKNMNLDKQSLDKLLAQAAVANPTTTEGGDKTSSFNPLRLFKMPGTAALTPWKTVNLLQQHGYSRGRAWGAMALIYGVVIVVELMVLKISLGAMGAEWNGGGEKTEL